MNANPAVWKAGQTQGISSLLNQWEVQVCPAGTLHQHAIVLSYVRSHNWHSYTPVLINKRIMLASAFMNDGNNRETDLALIYLNYIC